MPVLQVFTRPPVARAAVPTPTSLQHGTALMDTFALASHIAAGGDLSPTALGWLRDGFKRFTRGDASLEVALQLTAGSKIAARNRALQRAADLLNDGGDRSPWELSELLQKAVLRFEAVMVGRSRRGDSLALSPIDAAIADARNSGARMLRSRRRLYDLLLTNSP